MITPPLLFSGAYNMEPLSDLSWSLFSYGLLVMYHFVILQGLGLVSILNYYFLQINKPLIF